MPRVLCASLIADQGPHIEMFPAAGFELKFPPADRSIFQEDGLIAALQDCDAVCAGAEPYTRKVIEACPKLRVIARSGVGFDAIDLKACDEHGVVVCTTPGVNHHAVAEHTIALLMGIARGFPRLDQQVRTGQWQREPRPRVMGSTLGLVGLGRIGRAVATRAVGLGMRVVAFDPYPQAEFVEQWRITMLGLDELLAESDYVSLHLPMSAENRYLMNAERFKKMKPGSVLINTARGPLVDEDALHDALQSGHLRGAGLDVFVTEPLPLSSPLLEFDNVLLSGHVAGLDQQSHDDTFAMVARIITGLRDGVWPDGCVQNLKGVANWKWDCK